MAKRKLSYIERTRKANEINKKAIIWIASIAVVIVAGLAVLLALGK